jgi:hypothetical protein
MLELLCHTNFERLQYKLRFLFPKRCTLTDPPAPRDFRHVWQLVGVADSCVSELLDCTFSVEWIVDGDVVILLPVVNNRSGVSLRDVELLTDLLGVSTSRSSSSPSLLCIGCTGEGCGI